MRRRLAATLRVALVVALALSALLSAADAAAGSQGSPARPTGSLLLGVDDDTVKWRPDPQTTLAKTLPLGVDALRVTFAWQPGQRYIHAPEHNALRRVAAAGQAGLRIVLAVYGDAASAPTTAAARDDYCHFVSSIIVRYGEIKDVVIWNEANSASFWQPAAASGWRLDDQSAHDYEALLASCYDLLHAARPDINVLTSTAARWDALGFITALGAAYRDSGRARPIFDTFGHNPYPARSDESPLAKHDGEIVGEGDYGRLVRTFQRAFAATVQPLAIWYLEDGFQTAPLPGRSSDYDGSENDLGALSADEQARQLTTAVELAYCQPLVGAFFNFELTDERSLVGWQSGLHWADGGRKPAYAAYRKAIAAVHAGDVDCDSLLSAGVRTPRP